MFRAAVEREFTIVGEALMNLRKVSADVAKQIPNCDEIIGFRHVLVHGYSVLSSKRVWDALVNDVPVLLQSIETILGE